MCLSSSQFFMLPDFGIFVIDCGQGLKAEAEYRP